MPRRNRDLPFVTDTNLNLKVSHQTLQTELAIPVKSFKREVVENNIGVCNATVFNAGNDVVSMPIVTAFGNCGHRLWYYAFDVVYNVHFSRTGYLDFSWNKKYVKILKTYSSAEITLTGIIMVLGTILSLKCKLKTNSKVTLIVVLPWRSNCPW